MPDSQCCLVAVYRRVYLCGSMHTGELGDIFKEEASVCYVVENALSS